MTGVDRAFESSYNQNNGAVPVRRNEKRHACARRKYAASIGARDAGKPAGCAGPAGRNGAGGLCGDSVRMPGRGRTARGLETHGHLRRHGGGRFRHVRLFLGIPACGPRVAGQAAHRRRQAGPRLRQSRRGISAGPLGGGIRPAGYLSERSGRQHRCCAPV